MPRDSAKVRLPELPVFKKYSLALRQEFASADEVLSVLERTTTKIREGIERADEERRRQDQAALPDLEVQDVEPGAGSDLAEDLPDEADLNEIERPFWEEPSEEDASQPAASGSPLSAGKPGRTAKAKAKQKTRRTKPSVVRVGHHGKPLAPKKDAPKKAAPKKAAPRKAAPRKAAPRKAAPKKKTVTRRPAGSRSRPKPRPGSRRR